MPLMSAGGTKCRDGLGGKTWGDVGDKGQRQEIRSPIKESWRSDMMVSNTQ